MKRTIQGHRRISSIRLSFSDGIQQLNGEVSSPQTRFRMKNGNPTLYERADQYGRIRR